jgi:hypothetical protein
MDLGGLIVHGGFFLLVGVCLVLQLPKADLCWWDGAGLRFCFIMGRACLINSAGVCGVLS